MILGYNSIMRTIDDFIASYIEWHTGSAMIDSGNIRGWAATSWALPLYTGGKNSTAKKSPLVLMGVF
jgi:hypothetical protein